MGNFKDFDLDLKVTKVDGKHGNGEPLVVTLGAICTVSFELCPTIAYPCDTMSCAGSCDCSPSDMTACRQIPQGKNDIVPHC